jgi:nicotinamidase-related amidase
MNFDLRSNDTALLIVDMQNCFVEGYPISAPEGPSVVERLNRLATVCREVGIPVIYTAHVVRPDGSNTGVMGEIIPPVNAGVIDDGAESAALHPGLDVQAGDIHLKKPRFGAFHGTDLELILRSRGINSLILGGIATNVCVDTTAREASVRDYHVHVLSDGTATFGLPDMGMGAASAEEIQRVVCSTLAFAFARVRTVQDVIDELQSRVSQNVTKHSGVAAPA